MTDGSGALIEWMDFKKKRNLDEWFRMNQVAMRTKDRLRNLIPGLVCLCFALAAVSCQNNVGPPKTTRASNSRPGSNWVKVSLQPPTYYPRGVAADCPTDGDHGEWVYTEDEQGTRYFIPLHGLGEKREMLVHDALSARSRHKLDEVAAGDREKCYQFIKYSPITIPANTLMTIFSGGWGSSLIDEQDVDNFVAEVRCYERERPKAQ